MTKTKTWSFRDKRGRFRACRLSQLDAFANDPITRASGCASEFVNDWRRQDVRDGCPRCIADVAENLSEPDVLARWGRR